MISTNAGALLGVCAITLALCAAAGKAQGVSIRVSTEPLHSGRITTKLAGGFIELLDDLVPGMWAEMLNDRSFEGVTPRASWCYYTGAPNICDRQWDANDTWSYDTSHAFNGARCAKLNPRKGQPARLTQFGLAVKKGSTYLFSGCLRTAGPGIRPAISLKARLPDGRWMTLASAKLPAAVKQWQKFACMLKSDGTTDRAMFELAASGTSSLFADKLSLMLSDNMKGWRSDVVQAVRAAHPGVIRWGGSVVDPGGYRWKEGIGDRDRRTPFPNKNWGRIDSNDVGIDEFCQFCALVEAEPVICLSFSDGPQSARDLVDYCNGDATTEWGKRRAANGHPEPYRVKYWQLGNELGNADYVNGCLDFCKAIKAADPDAVIMSSYPSQDLLDKVGTYLGYVCPHHYTDDFAACEASIAQVSEMLRKTPGCENVKLGITEWNVTGGRWGLGRGTLLTLESALLNARYLNLLMRHSDMVGLACRSNMTNSLGSGMIQTEPAGLYCAPSYYAMKLYADHMKPVPVAIEGAPEGVDVAACMSEDGKSVSVFAVNMNTEPIQLSLDLAATLGAGSPDPARSAMKPIFGEAVCDTLDMRQKDIMNHWSAPDRVKSVKLKVRRDDVTLPALSAVAIECHG